MVKSENRVLKSKKASFEKVKQKVEDYIWREISKEKFSGDFIRKVVEEAVGGGGKRIRGVISYCFSKACGLSEKVALELAFFIELVHAFTLVHDDIIDLAEKRRGKESLWKKYGNSIGILAGDELFVWAFERLSEIADSKAVFFALHNVRVVVEGQVWDVLWGEEKNGNNINDVIKIQAMKTASLFEVACVLPFKVAGFKNVKGVKNFARHFGLAFQIADDFQDVEEDRKAGSPNIVLALGEENTREIFESEMRRAKSSLASVESKLKTKNWTSPLWKILTFLENQLSPSSSNH